MPRTIKDPDARFFSQLVPHTIIYVTIEDTPYRNRPHRVIFWGEHHGEPAPIKTALMTDNEIEALYQIVKSRIEVMNNGNKKTNT